MLQTESFPSIDTPFGLISWFFPFTIVLCALVAYIAYYLTQGSKFQFIQCLRPDPLPEAFPALCIQDGWEPVPRVIIISGNISVLPRGCKSYGQSLQSLKNPPWLSLPLNTVACTYVLAPAETVLPNKAQ